MTLSEEDHYVVDVFDTVCCLTKFTYLNTEECEITMGLGPIDVMGCPDRVIGRGQGIGPGHGRAHGGAGSGVGSPEEYVYHFDQRTGCGLGNGYGDGYGSGEGESQGLDYRIGLPARPKTPRVCGQ